ncbi:hypothetical protein MASR1M32_18190 [Rhodobacter sp.]
MQPPSDPLRPRKAGPLPVQGAVRAGPCSASRGYIGAGHAQRNLPVPQHRGRKIHKRHHIGRAMGLGDERLETGSGRGQRHCRYAGPKGEGRQKRACNPL